MEDSRNKTIEHLFLDMLPKKEGIALNMCSFWLYRYYQEVEIPEMFASENYANQDERIDDMFPGMPDSVKNLFKFKAYKHRADHHGEKGNEKRIEELETKVAKTEYQEFTTQQWWIS